MSTLAPLAPSRRSRAAPSRWLPPASIPRPTRVPRPRPLPVSLIDNVIAMVARRADLQPADTDEFRSWTYEKLLKDDRKALRAFGGRSSMRTYLYAVISNLMRDFRQAHFGGRWRPSASAARLGSSAKTLDRLVNRDRVPATEALRMVAGRDDCDATELELRRLLAQVPARPRPRSVGIEEACALASPLATDARVLVGEDTAIRRVLLSRLKVALDDLADEDRQILRLRFWEGMTVADVSRSLRLPQKSLYRRLDGCLQQLRTSLEAAGVTSDDLQCLGILSVEPWVDAA